MVSNPLALIAEVTHRCPLHCVYCSNPLELAGAQSELSTAEWTSVFQQAGKLGMLHAHFTGGEPLARTDLTELIAAARAAGLYTNLITSGIGLERAATAGPRRCRPRSHPDQLSGFAGRSGELDCGREGACAQDRTVAAQFAGTRLLSP